MEDKVIDFNIKGKVVKLKKHPEFRVLNLDFEKILEDINFFKNNFQLIQKSEILFEKIFKKNKNYPKSVLVQQNFVEEFQEIV